MISFVQYLRGVAALLIVLAHCGSQWSRIAGEPTLIFSSILGQRGVDLFFVISGFIMWITTNDYTTPGQFLKRRIRRVVPLYWLVTFGLTTVAVLIPKMLSTTRFDFELVVASFLFLPWMHPVTHLIQPIVIPGWTLNYEMAFYLLFAGLLWLPRTWLPFSLAAILATMVAVGIIVSPSNSAAVFYCNDIILEFALGVLLGRFYTGSRRVTLVACIAMLSVGLLNLIASAWSSIFLLPRFVACGLPCMLILASLIFLERSYGAPQWKLPLLLGDASYSIYLTHFAVVSITRIAWVHIGAPCSPIFSGVFVVMSMTISSGFGIIVFLFIERKLLKVFSRVLQIAIPKIVSREHQSSLT